jgi:hypothetical protein
VRWIPSTLRLSLFGEELPAERSLILIRVGISLEIMVLTAYEAFGRGTAEEIVCGRAHSCRLKSLRRSGRNEDPVRAGGVGLYVPFQIGSTIHVCQPVPCNVAFSQGKRHSAVAAPG